MFLFELFDLQDVVSILESVLFRKMARVLALLALWVLPVGLSVALGESFTITYHSEGGSEIAPATYQSGEESVEPVWP